MATLIVNSPVGTRLPGMLLPLASLSLAGVVCVSTFVLYQAFYAYSAAQNYYRVCQQEYCLTGLCNQAADACIRFIKTSGNFTHVRTYTAADLLDPHQSVTITIKPCEHGYKITVERKQKFKTGTLFLKTSFSPTYFCFILKESGDT